jgi:hypothetical protein
MRRAIGDALILRKLFTSHKFEQLRDMAVCPLPVLQECIKMLSVTYLAFLLRAYEAHFSL